VYFFVVYSHFHENSFPTQGITNNHCQSYQGNTRYNNNEVIKVSENIFIFFQAPYPMICKTSSSSALGPTLHAKLYLGLSTTLRSHPSPILLLTLCRLCRAVLTNGAEIPQAHTCCANKQNRTTKNDQTTFEGRKPYRLVMTSIDAPLFVFQYSLLL
jgi:hypothetical protein